MPTTEQIVRELREEVTRRAGVARASVLIEFAEKRRPPKQTLVDTLSEMVERIERNEINDLMEIAEKPVEQLNLEREVADGIAARCAPFAGRSFDDPEMLRELRKTVARYLGERFPRVPAARLTRLVREHTEIGTGLAVRAGKIASVLFKGGYR